MKNWFPTLLGAGVVAGGLALTSCEDEFTEADAIALQDSTLTALDKLNHEQEMAKQKYQDSLNRIGPVINYTVSVIAGGSANTNARTEGEMFAEGATVTVTQRGVSQTATTDASGVAAFSDLRIGDAVVTVDAADHTSVTYTTSLGSSSSWDHQEDNVETTIPIFPLTVEAGASEVSGIVWAELDLTNDTPEFAEGAEVRATISVAGALGAYGIPVGSTDKGEIRTASYSGFIQTATVGADGRYSLIIPNGNGDSGDGLSADIEFLPYEAQQTYVALQGDSLAIVTKDVIFESTATENDDDHLDFTLPGVYVEVSEPVNNAQGFELEAKADRSDLDWYTAIALDSRGTGYTVNDEFAFAADADGEIAGIIVDNVDADGKIIDWHLESDLDGNLVDAKYDAEPALTQDASATGTGGSFIVDFKTTYTISVKSEGSGYWDVPQVNVTFEDYDNGVLVKQVEDKTFEIDGNIDVVNGKLKSDNVDNSVATTSPSASMPTITVIAPEVEKAYIDPSDIMVDAETGKITGIAVTESGSGYTTQPTLTIKTISGEGMGSGASAVADIVNGEVNNIQIINPGSGYLNIVNDDDHDEIVPTAEQNDVKTFKPASTNPSYNFNFGVGVVKQ